MSPFEKARKYMYRHARPLDLARWQYHFENGSRENVLTALSAYQNENGGFGYGLEADCWNPESSPIQTWTATEILREIQATDPAHPLVQGILRYLSSGRDFDAAHRQWMNTVPGNNEHPHAIWWTYQADQVEYRYNPTACLAGFFLKYADPACEFYPAALQIAQDAYQYFMDSRPYLESHVTACFLRLYEYGEEAQLDIGDRTAFKQAVREQVKREIDSAAGKWETEYVCMPSHFIRAKDSMLYPDNAEQVARECAFIASAQEPDGAFAVPWKWWTDYSEFEIARAWWKADFCIRNMLFLRTFAGADGVEK